MIKLCSSIFIAIFLTGCGGGGDASTTTTPAFLTSTGYFKSSNTGAGDMFGFSISLSDDGKVMAVGARHEDSSSSGINSTANDLSTDSGAVYVFHLNGSTWVQEAYIKASNPSNDDWFGDEVSLSGDGNTLAVGAPLAGAAYLYRFDGSNWSQEAYLKPLGSTGFGRDVSLSDDISCGRIRGRVYF